MEKELFFEELEAYELNGDLAYTAGFAAGLGITVAVGFWALT